jgi:hypothetical protein
MNPNKIALASSTNDYFGLQWIAPIHFIGAGSFEAAFAILHNIVNTRALFGSIGQIKGGYECVCLGARMEDSHESTRPGRS